MLLIKMNLMKKIVLIISIITAALKIQAQLPFTEILGRPTDNSISINVYFEQTNQVYFEYGTVSGIYTGSTLPTLTEAGKTLEADFTNLQPNTKYYYRTRYRKIGELLYSEGTEHSFYTQRALGSSFTFTIEADEHLYDKKGHRPLYELAIGNQVKDKPDFMLTLGDVFGDDHTPDETTSSDMNLLHKDYLQYFTRVCNSAPLFVCLGNHEGENNFYLNQTPPMNIAQYGTEWRKFYYPNPYPNNFYSGNTDQEPFNIGFPENYYAWTWGDVQFVVLDAYRYQSISGVVKPTEWDWTLGKKQYDWFIKTLEMSKSKYKFVFIHHTHGETRGGVVNAPLFEWGGKSKKGSYDFDKERSGWGKTIHQLLIDNQVNILFQGHDHLYSYEKLDGIVYNTVPMPSDSSYSIGYTDFAQKYYTGTSLKGSGHLRVSVTPDCATVDFVNAVLPKDEKPNLKNGSVSFSYQVCPTPTATQVIEDSKIEVFPNPANDKINIDIKDIAINQGNIILTNQVGQTVVNTEFENNGVHAIETTNLDAGIYFLTVKTNNRSFLKKVVIVK